MNFKMFFPIFFSQKIRQNTSLKTILTKNMFKKYKSSLNLLRSKLKLVQKLLSLYESSFKELMWFNLI